MEFKDNKAIYLQIADYVCEQILLDKWKEEGKVPSVRELAISLEVNPNTIMRTYELLQNKQIIQNKRGIGYFIDEDAAEHVIRFRKENFLTDDLPTFFRNMYLLNISFSELEEKYKIYLTENFNHSSK